MFVINGTDYTLVVIGIIGMLLFFAVQLFLCQKIKKMAIKLIPAYIILLFMLLAVVDLLAVFPGSGFISTQGILAIVVGIVGGFVLIGEIAAWVVHGILKKKIE